MKGEVRDDLQKILLKRANNVVKVSVWLQGKKLAHDLSYNDQIFDDDGSDHEVSGKGVKVWLPWVNQQP